MKEIDGGPAGTLGPAVLTLALAACLFNALEPPSDPPLISGTITWVGVSDSIRGLRVLIEENPGEAWVGEKDFLESVVDAAILVRQPDSSWQRGTVEDLQVGAIAQAWNRGLILDSYPGQATARTIAILRPPTP